MHFENKWKFWKNFVFVNFFKRRDGILQSCEKICDVYGEDTLSK